MYLLLVMPAYICQTFIKGINN